MGKKYYILIILSLLFFGGCGTEIKPENKTIEIVKIILKSQLTTGSHHYTEESSGNITNNIEESIYFETLSPLKQYNDDNPHEGKIKIITDAQTIIVTIIDCYNIEILVDYQTDHYQNSYKNYNTKTIYTTWEKLGFTP